MSGNGEPLPPGWENPLLPEVAGINPPLASRIIKDDEVVNFVPMRAVGAEGGGLVYPELRPYGEMKKGYKPFLSGDVIMAKITPCMENGKTAVVPKLRGELCFGSTEFHVIRTEDGVESRWIANFFLQHEVRRMAQRQMAGGVGQMRVPVSFLESTRIPVPPSDEQTRISDAIDELFSGLDAGVAALERVWEKLKLYRASILKAAVEGALTAEWRERHPNAEPATELLKRILAERRRRWEEDQLARFQARGQEPPKNWKTKYKEPTAPDAANLPSLPEGWCWASVDQIGWVGTGATPNRSMKNRYYEGGVIPWVTSTCVNSVHVREATEYVTTKALEECNLTLYPSGTLLLAMYGEGKTRGMCSELQIESTTNQAIAAIQASGKVKSYLKVFLAMNYHDLRRVASGGVQPNLNLGLVRGIVLPFPPAAEQESIVETVDDQLSVVDHLESDIEARLNSARALRQAILRHAFTGRLVPQDPNDEPASELLKRIAADRAARVRKSASPKGRVPKNRERTGGTTERDTPSERA